MMRLGIVMRDVEYRDALIEMLSEFDKDIFIEVAGESGAGNDCIILTDIRPEEIESDVLCRLKDRTVFVSSFQSKNERSVPSPDIELQNRSIHKVFKYSRLSSIISELSMVYSGWTGDTGAGSVLTRRIAVCAESDAYCSDRCRSLARQIIYRRGGSVIILPLGFINDYGSSSTDSCSSFARLMYLIDAGREYPADAFTVSDTYGIRYPVLPRGPNPIAYLDGMNLNMFIASISEKFDTVIFDIGTCYRMENIKIMRDADNTLCFGTGGRTVDVSEMLGTDHRCEFREFKITGEPDEALRIDDFVREIYRIRSDDGDIESKDSC